MIVSDADYETNVYVQKVDAEMRADCVASVAYNVTLCLPKGKRNSRVARNARLTNIFFQGRITSGG